MNSRLLPALALLLPVVLGPHVPTIAAASVAPAATWTLTPAVVSNYMFRGMRLSGPSFQPTLEYGYGNLVAGLWANVPIEDKVPGVSDPEIDLYGSHTFALNDRASLAVGATWYHFPRADEGAGFYRNTFEPNVALNYTVRGFRLTPKLYYDVVLKGFTAELTAFYAVPLAAIGSELDFSATYGGFRWKESVENSSPATKNWGEYWSAGVAMPFQVTANSKVTLGFAYVEGSNNYFKQGNAPRAGNSLAVGKSVASLAYSITF